ncbi:MAG: hypothetical protein M3340_07345 [Actinomycetota bacterium]|nr:hypothetical protein [Actinomycetota bacterium]
MNAIDEINRQGRALLAELRENPHSDCWRQFDALFYPIVWRYLRANHDKLAARVTRYLKLDGPVAPSVLPGEVDEVAHDATKLALRRVHRNAQRFDPARGTPIMWTIGAAEFAYVEVAKAIVAARRSEHVRFVPPEDLLEVADASPTTEEFVLQHLVDAEAMQDAANHLSEQEFAALRLVATIGYSYAEAADTIFGDATMTKQIDGLLSRGKRKLAAAWVDRRPSPRGASSSNLPEGTDDKEGSDG